MGECPSKRVPVDEVNGTIGPFEFGFQVRSKLEGGISRPDAEFEFVVYGVSIDGEVDRYCRVVSRGIKGA